MGSASKSNFPLRISSRYLSELCFTWWVSANVNKKSLLILLPPIIVLFICLACSVSWQRSTRSWPPELGKGEAEKASTKKELVRFYGVENIILSMSVEWKANRRQQNSGIQRVCFETKENILGSSLPVVLHKLCVLTTSIRITYPICNRSYTEQITSYSDSEMGTDRSPFSSCDCWAIWRPSYSG